ncbi:NrdH-redoxin [Rothia nasimurium]|uniref:NrdH-redoxin n=1 Tax=Rothia nasimurium TaxID=85336 RepID=A0A4Y9F6T5_9MICC|nr:glutaredoxin domain-containing protein [Rothia nasimurium]MBF0807552.1 NrdH-redoxin [Rothia nasimurium]TFU23483.1 NrdH-redoxin [Rothia nasimurium]
MTTINLYTTPNCHQCRLTQRKLNDRALPYRLIKLENEPAIAARLKARGLLQAPIVEVPGEETQIWNGYRPDLIDQLAARQAHHGQPTP